MTPPRTASCLLLAALLLAGLSLPARAAGPDLPEVARQHLALGLDAIEKAKGPDDYKTAVKEFTAAVAAAPDAAEGYFYLGQTLARAEGRAKAAINALNRYLALAPDAPDAAQVRAEIADLEKRRAWRAKSGMMGLTTVSLPDGIYVRNVAEPSPARVAGFRTGDKILRVDGREAKGMGLHEFGALLDGEPGTPCIIDVLRGGEAQQIIYLRILRGAIFKFRDIEADELEDEVRASALPVLAFIWSPGCAVCNDVNRVSGRIVSPYQGRLNTLSINLDDNPELAERMDVTRLPLYLFYRNGVLVDRTTEPEFLLVVMWLQKLMRAEPGGAARGN